MNTPFGAPSGPHVTGKLCGKDVAFLARHGTGHTLSPGAELPRQHLRLQDARRRAHPVGERGRQPEREYAPLDLVIPDQFVDRTRGRISTFFGEGLVGTSRSRIRSANT